MNVRDWLPTTWTAPFLLERPSFDAKLAVNGVAVANGDLAGLTSLGVADVAVKLFF